MTDTRVTPDALLALAIEMLQADVLPALPPEQRYAGAMVANASAIARRGIPGDAEAAEWALMDKLYDDGEGSPRQLALDIRDGSLPKAKSTNLAAALRAQLIEELRVANPKFLASRGISG